MTRRYSSSSTDSHFMRTGLSVEEPVGRVKRRFAVATGCCVRRCGGTFAPAPTPGWPRAGRLAGTGSRGQARACPAAQTVSSDGDGYQLRRWSNSKAGMGGSSVSAAGRGLARCKRWNSIAPANLALDFLKGVARGDAAQKVRYVGREVEGGILDKRSRSAWVTSLLEATLLSDAVERPGRQFVAGLFG